MSDTPTPPTPLTLSLAGRILDHLGLQMYQSPVAAIAELIANAWDADAHTVAVALPEDTTREVVVSDDGVGMTFRECQEHYLVVGRDRRNGEPRARTECGRRVLGRKGIGKFAGFGISDRFEIATTSSRTGEQTSFVLDYQRLKEDDSYVSSAKPIMVTGYSPPDKARVETRHGTTITLGKLRLGRALNVEAFRRSMARRFLTRELSANFSVTVNGEPLPDWVDWAKVQYAFPHQYGEELPVDVIREGDGQETWAVERVAGHSVRWRALFYKDPLEDEEFQGFSIFAGGKLVQTPFWFHLQGGLGGQHAQAYLSAQVAADYLDEQIQDLSAPERQRINWDDHAAEPLLLWGQTRTRELLKRWQNERSQARVTALEEKLGPFARRLGRLQPMERRTARRALEKLAQVASLSQDQFLALGTAIVQAWDQGRLKGLLEKFAEPAELNDQVLIETLTEANVLAALQLGEAVQAKIEVVRGLRARVEGRDLEGRVRDYIAEHPWLVSPDWETFRKETRADRLLEAARRESGLGQDPAWAGRTDLVLSAGDKLLVIEFMRPGLTADWDHLQRLERYVRITRSNVAAITAPGWFTTVQGYLVADNLERRGEVAGKIANLKDDGIYAISWDVLLTDAEFQWKEFLAILGDRADNDERVVEIVRMVAQGGS